MRGSDTNPCNVYKIWDEEQAQNVDYTTHVADVTQFLAGGADVVDELCSFTVSRWGIKSNYTIVLKM